MYKTDLSSQIMPIDMHQLLDQVGFVYTHISGEKSLLEELDPSINLRESILCYLHSRTYENSNKNILIFIIYQIRLLGCFHTLGYHCRVCLE